MSSTTPRTLRKSLHEAVRRGLRLLPDERRFALYRRMASCEDAPDPRLQLKIADTVEELEGCFALLHDAYVGAGFMKRDSSGLRVTPYHALPTTTTLCAKWEGDVVGTISLIREGVFGFPMQAAFDIAALRERTGQIAEISALAVHPRFRKTGGRVLFPLMKFMYEYCKNYFDARHLVIAVNPNKIELYEALLMFERLRAAEVSAYDFANGAPAVGAALDLVGVEQRIQQLYAGAPARRDLHRYFVEVRLPNITMPDRPLFTTNDPVMTPEILDHFFNRRTRAFEQFDERRRLLLRSIYDHPDYRGVLPAVEAAALGHHPLRRHQRFSLRAPAELSIDAYGIELKIALDVVEMSQEGFGATSSAVISEGTRGWATIRLGADEVARVECQSVRCRLADGRHWYGFRLLHADNVWQSAATQLERGRTHTDIRPSRPAPLDGAAAAPTELPRRPAVEAVVA